MARRRVTRSSHAGPNPVYRKPDTRWPVWFLPTVLGLITLGGFVALAWWPRFHVTRIEVSASASISPDRVRDFVRTRLEGSTLLVLPQSSQFVLSTRSLERSIQERLTSTVTLSELRVQRAWPDGIVVTVREASGAFVLKAADGNLLLDPSGIVVNRIPADAGGLFPVEDPQALPWAVGDRVLSAEALAGLAAFRSELAGIGVTVTGARLSEVTCYPPVELPPADANANGNTNTGPVQDPAPSTNQGANANVACDTKALVQHNPDLVLLTTEHWVLVVTVTGDRIRQLSDLTEVLATRTGAARAQLQSVDVRIPGRAYLR